MTEEVCVRESEREEREREREQWRQSEGYITSVRSRWAAV